MAEKKRKYGRPTSRDMLAMMGVNAALATFVMLVVFTLFGTGVIVGSLPLPHDLDPAQLKRLIFLLLLPGFSIGYACLWFWLILTGRSRGLQWGGACFYGMAIAFVNVPLCGFLFGIVQGNPLLAFALALASLMMIPSIAVSMIALGLTMGVCNAKMAQFWIEHHRTGA